MAASLAVGFEMSEPIVCSADTAEDTADETFAGALGFKVLSAAMAALMSVCADAPGAASASRALAILDAAATKSAQAPPPVTDDPVDEVGVPVDDDGVEDGVPVEDDGVVAVVLDVVEDDEGELLHAPRATAQAATTTRALKRMKPSQELATSENLSAARD